MKPFNFCRPARTLISFTSQSEKSIRRKRLSKKYIFDVCEIAFKSDETKSKKKCHHKYIPSIDCPYQMKY